MCGFAGFISSKETFNKEIDIASQMLKVIKHRGPDSEGVHVDTNSGVVLGFRRLSIQDLTSSGNQPMKSKSGRYWIIFNGEIYNHFKLRGNLKKIPIQWNGTSDTETILEYIENFGLENFLNHASGMFAFVLYDKLNKCITFARDRFGEKPLFYGIIKDSLVFASEIKSIKAFPNFEKRISKNALRDYFSYNYIPSPRTIFSSICKLEAGHYLTVQLNNLPYTLKPIRYFDPHSIILKAKEVPFTSFNEAKENIKNALIDSVSEQLISDVPLGCFLSGGIDSSLIASIMQSKSNKDISTFTIGFQDKSYDESEYAERIASFLGTNHTTHIVTEEETRNVIPLLIDMYDEPFSDSSQIPTYLVSKYAKQKITVALSGDGGDELFGGYNRYIWASKIWKYYQRLPRYSQIIFLKLLRYYPRHLFRYGELAIKSLLPRLELVDNINEKLEKLRIKLSNSNSKEDFYFTLIQNNFDQKSLFHSEFKNFSYDPIIQSDLIVKDLDFEESMMLMDTITYLPDDILCKVDRASMCVSLETRAPFLNKNVFKAAWQTPAKFKINKKEGKGIIKDILSDYMPSELFSRPKSGFGIPIGSWFKGPLREMIEHYLDSNLISSDGFLNSTEVTRLLKDHICNKEDNTQLLWNILVFQLWLEKNR